MGAVNPDEGAIEVDGTPLGVHDPAKARELGFRTFLGCMEETSVGIAGSAAVASLADWLDLDGCLLLADDPFTGLELDDSCRWRLTDAPGLGVARAAR